MVLVRSLVIAVALLASANVAHAIDCAGSKRIVQGAECTGSSFSGRDFGDIDARTVIFDDSTFDAVKFSVGATLDGASFVGAAFSGDSTFTGVSTKSVNFGDISIDGALSFLSGGTDQTNTALEGSSFAGAEGGTVKFEEVYAPNLNFRDAMVNFESVSGDFTGADFTGAKFESFSTSQGTFGGVTFMNAEIDSLDIRGGTWSGSSVVFDGAVIGNIAASDASLADASFKDTTIRGGKLSGELIGVDFDGATISGVDFREADLTGASFLNANLEGVSFADTILKDATFSEATLKQVTIMNSDLSGADFYDVVDEGGLDVSGVGEDCCVACAAPAVQCGSECKGCGAVSRPAPRSSRPRASPKPAPTMAVITPVAVQSLLPGESPVTIGPVDSTLPDPEEVTGTESAKPGEDNNGEDNNGDDNNGDDDVCFPGSATVELEDGTHKSMTNLAVGDLVRVSESEFSAVYFFSHKMETSFHKMVRIEAADSTAIEMTPSHYLYINDVLSAAGNAKTGDFIKTVRSGKSVVTSVRTVMGEGLFNPHTRHGDIVVDGVMTSTFTTSVPPSVASLLLLPERLAFSLGVSVYGPMLEGQAPTFLTSVRSAVLSRA